MIPRDRFVDKLLPWLLLGGNLLCAVALELAHDEAYYWLYARHLDWGFFDHPPLVGLMIAATSWVPGELGVRLGFVLATQGIAWALARALPRERRWQVWLSFHAFPLLAFAGVFALPDGAFVVAAFLWLLALRRSLGADTVPSALLVGGASALLLYAKYHGVLLIAGALVAVPGLLRWRTFWLATLVGLALFLPHLLWQYQHDFVSLRFHFFQRPTVSPGWRQPVQYLALQLVFAGGFAGPLLWSEILRLRASSEFEKVLRGTVFFALVFFALSTLNKKLEANWLIVMAPPMVMLLTSRPYLLGAWVRRLALLSASVTFVARLVMVAPLEWHGLKRGREVAGWRAWAQRVEELSADCHLVANTYQVASKLSFYLRREVPALNVRSRANQFDLWQFQKTIPEGPVCWVTKDRRRFQGEPVRSPDGKELILVKGLTLADILKHRTE